MTDDNVDTRNNNFTLHELYHSATVSLLYVLHQLETFKVRYYCIYKERKPNCLIRTFTFRLK
jgi:hypothetical protein